MARITTHTLPAPKKAVIIRMMNSPGRLSTMSTIRIRMLSIHPPT
jgi:hypothetical protein